MKKILLFLLITLCSCNQNNSAFELSKIIEQFENYDNNNKEKSPLGNYSEESIKSYALYLCIFVFVNSYLTFLFSPNSFTSWTGISIAGKGIISPC